MGCFKLGATGTPTVGSAAAKERAEEVRVEIDSREGRCVGGVVAALRRCHPYDICPV